MRLWQPNRVLCMPAGLGSHGRATAGGSTVSSPAAGTQYDDGITLAVLGTGFTGATVISIDGTPYGTTFVSATQVDVAVPTARTVGSPLRTSGAHTVTANTGGSASWTVNAWSEIDETACTGLWIASTANCAGATTQNEAFSPWTDLNGTENLAGGGGSNNPQYRLSVAGGGSASADFDTVPSVYCGTARTMSRTAQTLDGVSYMVVFAARQYFDAATTYSALTWSGNFRKLEAPANTRSLRWTDVPNGGGGSATVDTGVLGNNGEFSAARVFTFWREADDDVRGQINADAELTASSSNDSSGTGGTLTVGGANSQFIMPYFSTWSADPGATIRARARNKAMILTGLA